MSFRQFFERPPEMDRLKKPAIAATSLLDTRADSAYPNQFLPTGWRRATVRQKAIARVRGRDFPEASRETVA
jgi:hypothetical protein